MQNVARRVPRKSANLPSSGDPSHARLRTLGMLQTLDDPQITVGEGASGRARIPRSKGDRGSVDDEGCKDGAPQAASGADGVEARWVWHMRRIAKEGDEAAFGELFAFFAPKVKAFLMKSGVAPALAEECTQDVMVTVWHKAAQFDPTKASVATWVFTIARNRRIDLFRRGSRPEPEDIPWLSDREVDPFEAYAVQQESERLAAALQNLPPAQRSLIEKAFYGELSHSEIAGVTGLPLGTIKSRIRLALEKLRQALG